MTKNDKIVKWLKWAIASFENDPPDNKFQEGYLVAMQEALEEGPHYKSPAELKKSMNALTKKARRTSP